MSNPADMDGPLHSDKHPAAEKRAQAPGSKAAWPPAGKQTSKGHPVTIASAALLVFAVSSAATGQLMLKHGMQIASGRAAKSGGSLVIIAATSPWILFGLAVFAVSAVAWLAALSRVPLSVAYPFNALGYLVILTASVLVLHERANAATWTGSLLVVSGLLIVVLAKP